MKVWYFNYLALLTKIAQSRYPALSWLWFGLLGSISWACFWLFAEERKGGELLLPFLLSLWLLNWIFIRLVFGFRQPLLPAGAGWRLKLRFYGFYFRLHGTASLIFLLILVCVLISLKLASVVWRSFA